MAQNLQYLPPIGAGRADLRPGTRRSPARALGTSGASCRTRDDPSPRAPPLAAPGCCRRPGAPAGQQMPPQRRRRTRSLATLGVAAVGDPFGRPDSRRLRAASRRKRSPRRDAPRPQCRHRQINRTARIAAQAPLRRMSPCTTPAACDSPSWATISRAMARHDRRRKAAIFDHPVRRRRAVDRSAHGPNAVAAHAGVFRDRCAASGQRRQPASQFAERRAAPRRRLVAAGRGTAAPCVRCLDMPGVVALGVVRPAQDAGNDVVALQQALAAAGVDFGRLIGASARAPGPARRPTPNRSRADRPAKRRTREAIERTWSASASRKRSNSAINWSDGSRRAWASIPLAKSPRQRWRMARSMRERRRRCVPCAIKTARSSQDQRAQGRPYHCWHRTIDPVLNSQRIAIQHFGQPLPAAGPVGGGSKCQRSCVGTSDAS